MRWQELASEEIDFQPYQTPRLLEQFPQTSPSECEYSVVLIHLPSRGKWKGAEAVFRVLATNQKYAWPLSCYRRVPLFAPASEAIYWLIARNRVFFSKISKRLFRR